MFIKLKNDDVYVESFIITILAASASFYTYFPGLLQNLLIIIWGIIMLKNLVAKGGFYIPLYSLLVIAMILVSIKNNYYLASGGMKITIFTYWVALAFVIMAYTQEFNWYENTIKMLIVPYFIYSAYTIAMHYFPPLFYLSYSIFKNESMLRHYAQNGLSGLTNHYSMNAILIANGLMIGACFVTIYRKNYKAIFYTIVSLLALLWTGKRAHVIFAVVAIICTDYVFLSDNKRIRRKHMIAIISGIIIALGLIITFFPSLATFINRFEETAEAGDVTLGRTTMWMLALEQFKEHPITGIGWCQFRSLDLNPLGYDVHNVYVQLLCETGLVGFIVFVLFFGYCLFANYKMIIYTKKIFKRTGDENTRKKITLLLISFCNQVFFLIYCLTGNPLYVKENYIPYFIACAYAITEYRRMKEQTPSKVPME